MTEPVEETYHDKMRSLARMLDAIVNDGVRPRKIGFCLFMFNLNDTKRVNYISNANRADVVSALREWLEDQT